MEFKDRIRKSIKDKDCIQGRDLLNIKSIKQNPISERLLESYSNENSLDFERLYCDLTEFVNGKDIDSKLKVIFRIYDSNNDGFITKIDLFTVIKSYSDCKSDNIVTDIVNYTFNEAGLYVEKIDYEMFKKIILDKSKNLDKLLKCR